MRERFFILCLSFLFLISCKSEQKNSDALTSDHSNFEQGANLLSSGANHACTNTNDGIKCWGDNSFGQLNVPSSINNPSELIAGETSTCAINNKKIVCWGNNGLSTQLYPNLDSLQNPRMLTMADPGSVTCSAGNELTCWDSGASACAVTDQGVKCWSGFMKDITIVTQNIDQMVATKENFCILSKGVVKCWADHDYHQINFFEKLKNVKQFALGLYTNCALTESKAICEDNFGTSPSRQPYEINLNNPKQIQIGARFICALDSDGVKCWGDQSSPVLNIPNLKNPRKISAGISHVCALDDSGVVCWGNKLLQDVNYFKPATRDQSSQINCTYGSSNCVKDNMKFVYAHTTSNMKVIYSDDFYAGRDDGFNPLKNRSFKVSAISTDIADLELELCQFVVNVQKVELRTIYGNFFLNTKKTNDRSCNSDVYPNAKKIKSLGYIWSKTQEGLAPLNILNAIWASSKYLVFPIGDKELFDPRKYESLGALGYVMPIN